MTDTHTRHATHMMFQRYSTLLDGFDDEKQKPYIPKECHVNHLKWMCENCIENIEIYPLDKLNRWLGFIQGVCIMHGFTTTNAERNASRPLFHTAYKLDGIAVPPTLNKD